MAGVDGGQDLLIALRAGDEQKLLLQSPVQSKHERSELPRVRQARVVEALAMVAWWLLGYDSGSSSACGACCCR